MTDYDTTASSPADILTFWRGAGPDRWFKRDDAFDADIRVRFLPLWERAVDGDLASWAASDDGTLALLLVLDQFPRNLFRNDPRAFATDADALALARRAIDSGVDRRIAPELRQFVYMPLMHSEHRADQAACVALFRAHGDPDNLKYAELHETIIDRFGRFPHRNRVLGRATTADEQAFLDGGGFAG